MTEATTDTVTDALPPQQFKDEINRLQFEQIEGFIGERNSLVGILNAASGDRITLTEQIRETSTDPDIVAAREAAAEAEMRLHALVKPLVDKIIEDSKGSQEEAENRVKELDGLIKPSQTLYKKLYGEDAYKYFTKLERAKGAAVGRGSGVRRIRGFNVIVTIDGEPVEFDNFATAAKHVDFITEDLQKAFFEAAKTDVLKDIPDVVNFTVNFEDTDADGNKETKEAFVKAYRSEAVEVAGDAPEAGNATEGADETGEGEDSFTPDESDLEGLV